MSEERLSRIEQLVEAIGRQVEANTHAIAHLSQQLETSRQELIQRIEANRQELIEQIERSRQELQDEVRRWDERFFKFAEDTANRANTLIASAVIAGVLLLILKQQ